MVVSTSTVLLEYEGGAWSAGGGILMLGVSGVVGSSEGRKDANMKLQVEMSNSS